MQDLTHCNQRYPGEPQVVRVLCGAAHRPLLRAGDSEDQEIRFMIRVVVVILILTVIVGIIIVIVVKLIAIVLMLIAILRLIVIAPMLIVIVTL